MVRIGQIESGGIAEALDLEIGTRIIRINGERVRDSIDLTFLQAEPELEIETVSPDGVRTVLEIARGPGEFLGIQAEPDKIRECANECVFCFIDGNPPHVRDSLWLRDDDFRLSFTYGSYVTLTNLGPRGLRRLVDQRLSPLYVSVHATEPEVRIALLKSERAGLIMDHLRLLTEHGLEIHAQVVLCPGWNDGGHLDRTIKDLYGLGVGVRTLSIVPVGLTRYNLGRPVRLLSREQAERAVEQVEAARARALNERSYGWCYAADELFLTAERELPPRSYYDEMELLENGVGTVRHFLEAFEAGSGSIPPLPGATLRILTGRSMEPFLLALRPELERATGAEVEIRGVENRFYGESVTVAGLLAGGDLLRAVRESGKCQHSEDDVILLPAAALNHDELFIDSVSLDEFRRQTSPARVVAGHELGEVLKGL